MSAKISEQSALSAPAMPKIEKKIKLEELLNSPNIGDLLGQDDRQNLGRWVIGGYTKDLSTRTQWQERNAEAMKLALQIKEVKSFPWTGASNVKFPLVTIGALQFLARISILTSSDTLVQIQPIGADPDGKKTAQANRIASHINMQMIDEDPEWAEMDETTKFAACLLGSAFKKTYKDHISGFTKSGFVAAQNFVVDYNTSHLSTCNRASEIVLMNGNKIQERITQGFFTEEEVPSKASVAAYSSLLETVKQMSQGTMPSAESEDVRVIEQHTWFDFDQDGYAEPYTFFVREDNGHLYRIIARYFDDGSIHRLNDVKVRMMENLSRQVEDAKEASNLQRRAEQLQNAKDNSIVRIDPVAYYTKYTFVPSPDGGFYGLGLGSLLGPVNEAVDTLLNQMIDSGTMQNTKGGFLSRGVRLKSGKMSFDPFEWKYVDGGGDDLRKAIVPLPIGEPSNVLFQLLGILITYGEKISSATDIMTGVSPGQNTPASTAQTTVEQGMMLFSGIYKRMYRSFREEIQKFYDLNRLYIHTTPQYWDLTQGDSAILSDEDYKTNRFRLRPRADPSAISGQQKRDRATRLAAAASSPLGQLWDKAVVARKWLEAEEWNVDEIFPDPAGQRAIKPPVDPKIQLEQQKLQQQQQEHHDEMMLEVSKLQQVAALNQAKIMELRGKAAEHYANADSADANKQIAAIDAKIGMLKLHNDTVLKGADLMLKGFKAKSDIESQHHKNLMDLQDRLTEREAASRTGTDESAGTSQPKADPTPAQ